MLPLFGNKILEELPKVERRTMKAASAIVFFTIFISLCKGNITVLNKNKTFLFRPGTTINITWTFKVSYPITYRVWHFTPHGSSSRKRLADLHDHGGIVYYHIYSNLDIHVYKPSILELKNMDTRYNGEYTLIIFTRMKRYSRNVNVYIVVPTSCLSMTRFSTNIPFKISSTKNGSIEALSPTTLSSIPQSSVFASTNDNVLCDEQKERIKQSKTEWYIILITLTSGIIVGILVSILIVFQYRRHSFCKHCQQFQSPSEVRINSVDTNYQELDLSKMNKEDNYQSLRPKDDTVDKTYQELDISKMNIEDNNYESLQKIMNRSTR